MNPTWDQKETLLKISDPNVDALDLHLSFEISFHLVQN